MTIHPDNPRQISGKSANARTSPEVETRTLRSRLPNRRTVLKIVHWAILPLFIWFLFVTPDDVLAFGGQRAFRVHSVLALIFVLMSLGWCIAVLRHGLIGRPGPKLGPGARRLHRTLHLTLIWGLFGVALTGLFMGVTSRVQLWAGGIIPVGVPLGMESWNDFAGLVHIYEYYALAAVVITHAGFHIWRHLRLRDNALRIMFPKRLHRFL